MLSETSEKRAQFLHFEWYSPVILHILMYDGEVDKIKLGRTLFPIWRQFCPKTSNIHCKNEIPMVPRFRMIVIRASIYVYIYVCVFLGLAHSNGDRIARTETFFQTPCFRSMMVRC